MTFPITPATPTPAPKSAPRDTASPRRMARVPIASLPEGAPPARGLAVALAALGAAAGQGLVYGVAPGFGLALWAALIAAAVFALRPTRLAALPRLSLAATVAAALLGLAEEASPLSVALAVAALALSAASLRARRFCDLLNRLVSGAGLLVRAPFALSAAARRARARPADRRSLMRDWAAPLALATIFAALFATANPMLARLVDFALPAPADILPRLGVWALFGALAATLVATKAPAVRLRNVAPRGALSAALTGEGAVLRGLVLFNALFALETASDAAFLWGGATLPEGMTYAEYAHRGAYPLLVAALLAGAVALVAMRPDAASPRAVAIRALTLAFVAQTVALVASAALRLDLYVGVYGLTPWRVAAFLWMGLVAVGLTLIVAAMATGRSRRWLASANAAAALATLLIGASPDPALIADYNLRHARETGGPGVAADIGLLADLGPSAIPAIDALLPRLDALGRQDDAQRLRARRSALMHAHRARMADWRSVSLRAQRLQARLDQIASAATQR